MNTEWRRPFVRPRCTWRDNIKIYHKEIVYEDIEWKEIWFIIWASGGFLLNTIRGRNFFARFQCINFTERNLLH
jgi:hypothetical protein